MEHRLVYIVREEIIKGVTTKHDLFSGVLEEGQLEIGEGQSLEKMAIMTALYFFEGNFYSLPISFEKPKGFPDVRFKYDLEGGDHFFVMYKKMGLEEQKRFIDIVRKVLTKEDPYENTLLEELDEHIKIRKKYEKQTKELRSEGEQ